MNENIVIAVIIYFVVFITVFVAIFCFIVDEAESKIEALQWMAVPFFWPIVLGTLVLWAVFWYIPIEFYNWWTNLSDYSEDKKP